MINARLDEAYMTGWLTNLVPGHFFTRPFVRMKFPGIILKTARSNLFRRFL